MSKKIEEFMQKVIAKNPQETEFHQAVQEVVESLTPYIEEHPVYEQAKILERIVEPERVVMFRVPWMDDKGEVQVNRGYRIQMNSAIGPYKGGLRFHPSVNLGILKFLAFEQVFKNSLTTLPMGGAKGGSDFNPKGKSDTEIMRFCQSFMLELWRHIGPDTDIPAGDIGVGGKEIGYMYGVYKKLRVTHEGVLTGKGLAWGGSRIRPEATGYGVVYFVAQMLATRKEQMTGKILAVSGFGQVAWGVVKKATEMCAKVVTLSGPDGYIYDPDGISGEKIDYMQELRNNNQDIVEPYAQKFNVTFHNNKRPWEVPCDIAVPCATQNELDASDARNLVINGCTCLCEGANMPCTREATEIFINNKILFSPGKASNAGGVAVSGLEMTQNSVRYMWAAEGVDDKLRRIMEEIHESCVKYGRQPDGYINYVKGANIAGFLKVATAMLEQGII